MRQESLRVALIGAAGKVAAPCHLNALKASRSISLVALCDHESSTLEALGKQHGVTKRFERLDEVLADPTIDAVDIVVPPHLHAELTIASLKAGKHVYVEKPMARNLGEARAMVEAADQSGARLMVGESYFFHAPHQKARALIDSGAIGTVMQVRQTLGPWLFNESEAKRLEGRGHDIAWRFDPKLSGGGDFPWMMDHGPHLFATARLLGRKRINTVCALARSRGFERETHLRGIASLTWLYVGGEIDGTWNYAPTSATAVRWVGFRSEVVGTEGTLHVFGEGGGSAPGYPQAKPVTLIQNGQETAFTINEGADRSWISNNSYYDQAHTHTLEHFASAILNDTDFAYTAKDGLHDLAATLATIRSAMEGRPQIVRELDDGWCAYAPS